MILYFKKQPIYIYDINDKNPSFLGKFFTITPTLILSPQGGGKKKKKYKSSPQGGGKKN